MPIMSRHAILRLIRESAEEAMETLGCPVMVTQVGEVITQKTGMGFNEEYLARELENLGYTVDKSERPYTVCYEN